MPWYHAVIIAAGLALGGLLSGGIYRTEVIQRECMANMVIRSNRVTGHVDIAGPYSSVYDAADWVRFFAPVKPAEPHAGDFSRAGTSPSSRDSRSGR